MSSSNGEKRNEKLRKRSSQSRDRKRMRSDESLNNDCSLKKKTCEQFESFSVKRNQTRTKLGLEIKIILYSTALELMSQKIQSTISHRTQFLVTLYTTLNYFLQLFERMIQRWKQV